MKAHGGGGVFVVDLSKWCGGGAGQRHPAPKVIGIGMDSKKHYNVPCRVVATGESLCGLQVGRPPAFLAQSIIL